MAVVSFVLLESSLRIYDLELKLLHLPKIMKETRVLNKLKFNQADGRDFRLPKILLTMAKKKMKPNALGKYEGHIYRCWVIAPGEDYGKSYIIHTTNPKDKLRLWKQPGSAL